MLKSCPFCTLPGKKVKAHIIPRAFFEDISADGSMLKQRELECYPKKMPVGVYDDGIWCLSCETKYGGWDNYAIDVLRTPLENFLALPSAYELEIDKPEELKLFFISLIWRASTSSQRLFNNVSLGKFADTAKRLLASSSPGSVEDFSTIISYSGADECLIAEPVKVRHSGVLFYRFYLGRFKVDIKVSSQPTPKSLRSAVIGHNEILAILRVPRDVKLVSSASKIAKQLTLRSTGPARKAAQAG
jgi:hypothetical protein